MPLTGHISSPRWEKSLKSLSSESDQLQIWLYAIAKEDKSAFRQLYDATSSKLFGFALRILQKRELAEEVIQESYVSIWNNAVAYQTALSAPMTWMMTIVRNKAIDLLRRSQHETAIEGEDFDVEFVLSMTGQDSSPPVLMELSQEARILSNCMLLLEAKQRQAVAMAYFHDLSHGDVAQQMALPVGTVKTWIRRSLDKLRLCMTTRGR